MIDLQSTNPSIDLAIDKVGVKGISHPVSISIDKENIQPAIATFDMCVDLPGNQRGTHMSRFLEILNQQNWELSLPSMQELLQITKDKLNAINAFIEAESTVFLEKRAPATNSRSVMDYKVKLIGKIENNKTELSFMVRVPVTTLCPCSKELAKYNAHNQRAYVSATIFSKDNLDISTIIKLIESRASSEVYGILKRADEKMITEAAYENPKFVEDLVREIADGFNNNASILGYTVEVENLESIHNHSAYAFLSKNVG